MKTKLAAVLLMILATAFMASYSTQYSKVFIAVLAIAAVWFFVVGVFVFGGRK